MTKKFQTISPIDGSVYIERAYSSDIDVKAALTKAKYAQVSWRKVSVETRADFCHQFVNALCKRKADIAEEITRQMGRPIQYSGGEIDGFADRARCMIDLAKEKLQNIILPDLEGIHRYIQREPLGIVLSMSPWNYPYLTAVNAIIPAIMAGNVVILKPSAQAPLIAERIKAAFDEVDLLEGVFQYLFLPHEQALELVKNTAIDYVAFTGSVAGGEAVQEAAKHRFIQLGLELGGKDAAYVREDADLASAVPNLVDGAFFNSGQSCCGIERIYVHESIYSDFVEAFCQQTSEYILADPLESKTTLGPMVSVKAAKFVRQQILDAEASGAKLCINSSAFPNHQEGTAYLAPQVLIDVDHTMSIMKDESFGPVVGIMSVSSDSQAIELINDSDFGLTASVWTGDESRAVVIGQALDVGTFFMNRCDYLDPQLAWSGFKKSGLGCTLSEIGYEQLTRPKSFHLRCE